jgi:hypothetical protein
MKARLITTRTVHVACPNCGETAGSVDHILDGTGPNSFGPWYCNACGRGYHGELLAGGEIELRLSDTTKVETLDHLVLLPQDKPVHFLVKGMAFVDEPGSRGDPGHKRNFYEEHSCPTNYIGVEMIAVDGDQDPHGLFKFVASVDMPEGYDLDEDYGDGPASRMLADFKGLPEPLD